MRKEFSYVEFAGVLLTDEIVDIAGIAYPGSYTIQDLVDNNPQFWIESDMNGTSVLHSFIVVNGTDIVLRIRKNSNPIPVTGALIRGRPVGR